MSMRDKVVRGLKVFFNRPLTPEEKQKVPNWILLILVLMLCVFIVAAYYAEKYKRGY